MSSEESSKAKVSPMDGWIQLSVGLTNRSSFRDVRKSPKVGGPLTSSREMMSSAGRIIDPDPALVAAPVAAPVPMTPGSWRSMTSVRPLIRITAGSSLGLARKLPLPIAAVLLITTATASTSKATLSIAADVYIMIDENHIL